MKRILLALVLIFPLLSALACDQSGYNAYVVSSDWRSAPIIDSETGQAVGQAYHGFAVLLEDVRDQKAYFYINVSDPSVPNVTNQLELYIPIDYMKKADVEEQNVPAIISLDTITLNPMAGMHSFKGGVLEVVARFYDVIGPMRFIQNVENGYLFLLGMNLVWVGEQEVKLIEYDD
jgi:hypothetical protein